MVIIWEGHGIIISFLIIFFVFCVSAIPNYSYADDIGLGDLSSYAGTSTGKSKKYTDRMKKVFSILRVVGTILSVVILTAIGLKFMMGSVEEKAEYKKSLLPYAIGAVIIFTGSWLPQLIFDLTNEVL